MAATRNISRWYETTSEIFSQFVALSGDHNAIHTDVRFAQALFGNQVPTEPIVHGALVMAFLSTDLWQQYGDGAAYQGCQQQQFRIPVAVGEKIGFSYEEIEQTPGQIGEKHWPATAIKVRVTAYKEMEGGRTLRLGGLLVDIVVPTAETLKEVNALSSNLAATA